MVERSAMFRQDAFLDCQRNKPVKHEQVPRRLRIQASGQDEAEHHGRYQGAWEYEEGGEQWLDTHTRTLS